MTRRYLVTSALPYVNNVPHLGTMVCVLSADVYARYLRQKGENVIYVLGTDEHGTTAEVKARKEGLTPRKLVDKYFKLQKDIYDWFNCKPDAFGRTSDKQNHELTLDIFHKLKKNGFIFKDSVVQEYCPKCKKYLSDRYVIGECPYCNYKHARGDQCENCGKLLDPVELINPKCSICGTKPEERSSEHLFIDLPKLEPEIRKWVKEKSKEGNWSKNAIRMTEAWLHEGLKPRCITRNLEWGIPVPDMKDRVFYSWFDAPIGYISITKKKIPDWHSWWHDPENVKLMQFMGKDNIPFHTILFPSFLMGAKDNYTLLHHISSNEYLNYEGGQFSKSRHLGVFADDAKKTGIPADLWRYYIMVNRPETADTDFSWEDFQSKINHELVANIGNLVNRVIKFINRFYDGKLPEGKTDEKDKEFLCHVEEKEEFILALLDDIKLKDGIREIMQLSKLGNQYFQENEPWKTIKTDRKRADTCLYLLANFIKDLALLVRPYMPDIAVKIEQQLNMQPGLDFSDLGEMILKPGYEVGKAEAIIQRLDDKKLREMKEMFSGDKKVKKDPFDKLELRVAKVKEVKDHPDADKLYIMKLDLGGKERQIVSGLVDWYKKKDLEGKKIIIVANLQPAKLRGVMSNGMLLAAQKGGKLKLLSVKDESGKRVHCGEKTKPGKQITMKQFVKVDFDVRDKKVYHKGRPLVTDDAEVRVDIGDGAKIS